MILFILSKIALFSGLYYLIHMIELLAKIITSPHTKDDRRLCMILSLLFTSMMWASFYLSQ